MPARTHVFWATSDEALINFIFAMGMCLQGTMCNCKRLVNFTNDTCQLVMFSGSWEANVASCAQDASIAHGCD